MGDKFIAHFNAFDYSDDNVMHASPAQLKDGAICHEMEYTDHFYLAGEWRSIEKNRRSVRS